MPPTASRRELVLEHLVASFQLIRGGDDYFTLVHLVTRNDNDVDFEQRLNWPMIAVSQAELDGEQALLSAGEIQESMQAEAHYLAEVPEGENPWTYAEKMLADMTRAVEQDLRRGDHPAGGKVADTSVVTRKVALFGESRQVQTTIEIRVEWARLNGVP